MCFQRPKRPKGVRSTILDIQLIDNSRQLPSDFAIRLIEREMSLDKQLSVNTIQNLVDLYSLAIEHYSLKGDNKAKDYQAKMSKMLRKPEVLALMSGDNKPRTAPKNDKEDDSYKETLIDKISDEDNDTQDPYILPETPETRVEIEEAVKKKEIDDKDIGNKLLGSLKSQESSLDSRLMLRKQNKLSSSMIDLSPISEPLNTSMVDLMDRELDELIRDIMEKNYEEKASKIAEVTVRYNTEINDMEDTGMMGMVVSHMKQQLKNEIDAISQEFDEKRRNQIKKFKEEYYASKNKMATP
jgi:hypothetical protein